MFNYQIKLTIETKCGIRFSSYHAISISTQLRDLSVLLLLRLDCENELLFEFNQLMVG